MELIQKEKNQDSTVFLESFIKKAGDFPGVKVEREEFLRHTFKRKTPTEIQKIIEMGPIQAEISRNEIKMIAKEAAKRDEITSVVLSFATGMPGGVAMFGTITADVLQYYANVLKIIQKILYLYGWDTDVYDSRGGMDDAAFNAVVLCFGTMFGVKAASTAFVKIGQKAVDKTARYFLLKNAIAKGASGKIARTIIAEMGGKTTMKMMTKGVMKAVPVIGGVTSAAITWVSIKPAISLLINKIEKLQFGD